MPADGAKPIRPKIELCPCPETAQYRVLGPLGKLTLTTPNDPVQSISLFLHDLCQETWYAKSKQEEQTYQEVDSFNSSQYNSPNKQFTPRAKDLFLYY